MSATFGVGADSAGTVITATQVGYAAGILLIAPLGDRLAYRRLISATIAASVVALACAAASPTVFFLAYSLEALGLLYCLYCRMRISFTFPPHPAPLRYNVLTLRVSPSGKAQASQACIRGFESRHPLHEPSIQAPAWIFC